MKASRRLTLAFALLTMLPAHAQTPQYAWTNFAGQPGISGSANGIGSAAQFNSPSGMASDGSGNLYVADTANDTLRMITSAGVVTTLAGSPGVTGSTNGPESAARFHQPRGVAFFSGTLYVGDSLNDTIRSIMLSAQTVSTLAGTAGTSGSTDGTGSAALFDEPYGTAVDASGNVYVADQDNSTIRMITSAGVVSTLAGTAGVTGSTDGTGSAALFNHPHRLAVDGSGNVYVADTLNSTIRMITSAGVVTTLAGKAGKTGSADGTGSAARFDEPHGIAVDGNANVYVADTGNNTIRLITSGGVVTTIGGTAGGTGTADGTGSAAQFNGPDGMFVSSAGVIYLADSGNNRISTSAVVYSPILALSAVSGLGTSAVTLHGTVNPNGSATTAQFVYGLTPSYGSSATVTLSPNNGITAQSVSAALTGLQPGTTYHYQLTATNGNGTCGTSDATFTTVSNVATLSSLVLSGGASLAPAFSSGTGSYTASVPNATTSITITPTATNSNATVTVNGVAVASGSASGAIALAAGSNTLTTVVTAQDGLTTQTYIVTVTRLTGMASWRFTYFGTTSTSGNLADLASFSGDGIPNLTKYAIGLNPTLVALPSVQPGAVGGSTNPLLDDRLALNLTLPNPAPGDLTYTVQASSDLVNWTTVATKVGTAGWLWNPNNYPTTDGNTSHIMDPGTSPSDNVQVGDLVPASGHSPRMMRLQVVGP